MKYKDGSMGCDKSMATAYNEQYMKDISGSTPKEFSQDYMVKKVKAKPMNKNWNMKK